MTKRTRKTLLVADDDRFATDTLVWHLEAIGFSVIRAFDGDQTLRVLEKRKGKVDLVLLDIMMPLGSEALLDPKDTDYGRSTGFAVARMIKKKYPRIKILALSGRAEPTLIRWFETHGSGYIKKPVGLTEIEDKIRAALSRRKKRRKPRCFIVHGRDNKVLDEIKDFLNSLLDAKNIVVLRDQPSLGRTIIEKFEEEAEKVDIVFVLLTPDDKIAPASASDDVKRRARQNVVFEMGYFFAKLQRRSGSVVLLHKGDVELPSDVSGIAYIDISNGVNAVSIEIQRELKEWL